MKLGIVFVMIGVIIFLAWLVVSIISLTVGDYMGVVWMTIYAGIAGGIVLYNGIRRIRKAGSKE